METLKDKTNQGLINEITLNPRLLYLLADSYFSSRINVIHYLSAYHLVARLCHNLGDTFGTNNKQCYIQQVYLI